MKTICVYDQNDFDGVLSAAIVELASPGGCHLISFNPDTWLTDLKAEFKTAENREVYFVDCCPRNLCDFLNTHSSRAVVYVCDHHQWTVDNAPDRIKKLPGMRDKEMSGAECVFHTVSLSDDYTESVRAFLLMGETKEKHNLFNGIGRILWHYICEQKDRDFDRVRLLVEFLKGRGSITSLIESASRLRVIDEYKKKMAQQLARHLMPVVIGGQTVYMGSDYNVRADTLLTESRRDIVGIFYPDKDGIRVVLRSKNGEVGKICSGIGQVAGHPNAHSLTMSKSDFYASYFLDTSTTAKPLKSDRVLHRISVYRDVMEIRDKSAEQLVTEFGRKELERLFDEVDRICTAKIKYRSCIAVAYLCIPVIKRKPAVLLKMIKSDVFVNDVSKVRYADVNSVQKLINVIQE